MGTAVMEQVDDLKEDPVREPPTATAAFALEIGEEVNIDNIITSYSDDGYGSASGNNVIPTPATFSSSTSTLRNESVGEEQLVNEADSNRQLLQQLSQEGQEIVGENSNGDWRQGSPVPAVSVAPEEMVQASDKEIRITDNADVERVDSGRKAKNIANIAKNEISKRNERLDCCVCGRVFGLRWNLVAHMRIHTGERPFNCPACPQAFKQFAHLQKHINHMHPGVPVPLPKKIKTLNASVVPPEGTNTVSHNIITPPSPEDSYKEYKLRECNVIMSRWDVDEKQPMSSDLILQKFNSMTEHIEGSNLPLQVEAEGRTCTVHMDADLLAHFLQPVLSPPSSPSNCVGVYINLNNDRFRPSSPERKKPGPKSKTTLPQPEQKRKRGRPKGSFSCIKPGSSHSALHIRNMQVHSESKKVNKILKTIPSNVGTLGCTICGRKFGRLDVLKKHMQIHNGQRQKSFQCPTCSKCFMSGSYLISHIRTHTGERPYACETCGKRFSRNDTLKQHIRLHTGEKPYHCPNCPERFMQLSRLHVHIRKYHPGETPTYKCSVCLEAFTDEYSLTAHSATH